MYVTVRSWKSSIMNLIGREWLELSAFYFKKMLYLTVYTLSSANINQSAPNLVTMYMSIRFQTSSIMGQVVPDQSVLSAFEIEKLNFSSLFGIYSYCSPALLSTQVSDIGPSWFSCFFVKFSYQNPIYVTKRAGLLKSVWFTLLKCKYMEMIDGTEKTIPVTHDSIYRS